MRIYAYIAAFIAIAGLAWYEIGVHKKAARVEAAEARITAVENEKVELAKTFADATKVNRDIATELGDFRAEEATRGQELQAAIKDSKRPLVHEVTHVDPKTGAKNTCDERDPVRFSELFNQAVGPPYP